MLSPARPHKAHIVGPWWRMSLLGARPSMPPFIFTLTVSPSYCPCTVETLDHSHTASVGLLSAPGSPGGGHQAALGGAKKPPRKTKLQEAAWRGGRDRGSRCTRVTHSEPRAGGAGALQAAHWHSWPECSRYPLGVLR